MPETGGALGVRKVSHVSVCVSDMARAIDFYREMFGFDVLFDDKLDGPELDRITGVPGARGRAVGSSSAPTNSASSWSSTCLARRPGAGIPDLLPVLTNADAWVSLVCMRTTLNIDPDLLAEARRVTGVKEKTAVIELGLRKLVEEAARQRLTSLAGTVPSARAPRRRRSRRH